MSQILKFFCCVIAFNLSADLFGQEIHGKLNDQVTDQPIPYAHIYAPLNNIGTVTNEYGEFSLLVNLSLNDTLIISHIAYQTLKAPLKNSTDSIYALKLYPEITVLDEVSVTNIDIMAVVNNVMDQLKNGSTKYAEAFYRQTAFKGADATEWIEAFYKIEYTINGINKIKIDQARFARRKYDTANLFLSHTNFSYMTVGNSIYSPKWKTDDPRLGQPFGEDFIDDYNFFLDKHYRKQSKIYYVVSFEPKESIRNPVNTHGYFIYNKSDSQLVQYTAIVDHALGSDEIEYEGEKDVTVLNPRHTFQFNFSERIDGIDYISVDFTYDFVQDGETFPSKVSSKFILYKVLDKKPKKLRKAELELEDVSNFENAKYRPKFWRDNPVIKLTPEEKAIIATFEEENAFGTYFK